MKKPITFILLATANLVLLGWLMIGPNRRETSGSDALLNPDRLNQSAAASPSNQDANPENVSQRSASSNPPATTAEAEEPSRSPSTPETAFGQVYSSDPKQFVANLRAIHCPEQTIQDILMADVHRRFKAQEEALRPKPADHVPFTWAARTTEPKLAERRQKAADMAREQSAVLRSSLSCEVTVPIPLYALTTSDQRFEEQLATTPNACAIREVQDTYWADVHALQLRTKGFWLPEDVAELERLKAKRRELIAGMMPH